MVKATLITLFIISPYFPSCQSKINKTDDISAFEIADLSSVFLQAAVSELCHNSKKQAAACEGKTYKAQKCFAQG